MANERRIRIGSWLIPYDDAQADIKLQRTLKDVLTAVPGSDTDCMNSRCIQAHKRSRVFPHPVYMVSTTKSRIYIVDQLSDTGEPTHAVRYELSRKDERLVGEHDSHGAGEPGELHLRVPRHAKGSSNGSVWDEEKVQRHAENRRNNRKDGKAKSRPVMPRRATARFKVDVGALTEQ